MPTVLRFFSQQRKPFPWRLRLSFAMDLARAVAYLHARSCLHRDLKGENALVTANDRIKVCDFGFARLAARNEDEMKRMSYCGTDGYMSPEILMGMDFSLPSDVFSLGVIFCEIAARHLVDSSTFRREMPSFGLDSKEIREMASEGCPDALIELCLDCVKVEPEERPDMRQVIYRLRLIEMEIIAREEKLAKGTLTSVGSLRGASLRAVLGSKKKSPGRNALPAFKEDGGLASHDEDKENAQSRKQSARQDSNGSSDEEFEAALAQLEEGLVAKARAEDKAEIVEVAIAQGDTIKTAGQGYPWPGDEATPLIDTIKKSWLSAEQQRALLAQSTNDKGSIHLLSGQRLSELATPVATPMDELRDPFGDSAEEENASCMTLKNATVQASESAFKTAPNRQMQADTQEEAASEIPIADIASSILRPAMLYHRFTLVKNGTRRPSLSKLRNLTSTVDLPRQAHKSIGDLAAVAGSEVGVSTANGENPTTLLPPAIMLSQALSRCHVCSKRIGWKPFLDCDDCPYKCHVACSEWAEPTCQEMMPLSDGIQESPYTSLDCMLGSPDMANGLAARQGQSMDTKHTPYARPSPILTTVHAQKEPGCASPTTTTPTHGSPVSKEKGLASAAAAKLRRWSRSPPGASKALL